MITSRRRLSGLACGLLGATALAACSSVTPAVIVSDAQAVANDAAGILALGIIPQPYAGIASLVLTGFSALLAVVSGSLASGASVEATTIASLTSAVKSLQSDIGPGSPAIYAEATTALTLLGTLSANSSASLVAQVEATVGAVLIAYLQLHAPASAVLSGPENPLAVLVADAHGHIASLKAK